MSVAYWDRRYADGRDSGEGSRGRAAQAKADRINTLVDDYGLRSVVDLGCGDGQVASLLDVPEYLGVEVSYQALQRCIGTVGPRPGWSWMLWDPVAPPPMTFAADLTLSCDVIFHLIDPDVYAAHLAALFTAPHVLVHATDYDSEPNDHMRHHRFTADVPDTHRLLDMPADRTVAGFYEFEAV